MAVAYQKYWGLSKDGRRMRLGTGNWVLHFHFKEDS